MGEIRVILNPTAGRGLGARVEPDLCQALEEEGLEYSLVRTERPWHAAELAEQAAGEGFELVVAVGGDGTAHEVVNGLVTASGGETAGTFGVIPVGSGSDFANTIGVPPGMREAVRRLANGRDRVVDVGRVTISGQAPRYMDNTVNIGFGGVVTRESRKVKYLRGIALYLPVVLKTVFLYYKAPQVTIEYDDQQLSMPAVMVCVANGSREGGGFHVAPDAQPDDGLFDLCVAHEMSRLAMLAIIPSFMSGTHVGHKNITMARAKRVAISSSEDLIAHIDGEMLCTKAHRIEFEILPNRLRVRC
jgi:YegS/Rv2252/BmrU family lipid kinase